MNEQKPRYRYEPEDRGWIILLFAATCCLFIFGFVVLILVLSGA